MQKTTHGFLNMMQTRRVRSRQMVAGWLILAVCGLSSVSAQAKPMTDAAIASRTVRSDDAGVVLQVRSGDSLRDIAQYYSRKHNIPFQKVYEQLIQVNQAQLPGGDPDRMQVGAQIVLPNRNAAGTSAASTVATAPAVPAASATTEPSKPEATAANTAPPVTAAGNGSAAAGSTSTVAVQEQAKPTAAAPATPPVTSAPSAPSPATSVAQSEAPAPTSSWLERIPQSLWVLLIPALLLGLGVAYLMRRPRVDEESTVDTLVKTEPVLNEAEVTTAAASSHHAATPGFSNEAVPAELSKDAVAREVVHAAEPVEPVALAPVESDELSQAQEPAQFAHTEKSSAGATPSSVLLVNTGESAESAEFTVSASADEEGAEVLPEAAEEIQHRFKQALHGLTADKLDLRKLPADTTAAAATAVSENVALGASTSAASSRLNVNHLLRQYADHTLDKTGQVNYYALAERTRLQKWMSTQSEDDLLTHAQKAYGEGYPNVAHHILNEVLLRGNAAQCTRALDLRNEWHIQALRQNAQQNRDS